MNSDQYLATGLAQSILTLLEPSYAPACVGIDYGTSEGHVTATVSYNTAEGQITDCRTDHDKPNDSVRRIQRATADACAKWFMVVRSALGRERDRQQKFRVEHGLPKSARIPYQKPIVEGGECAAWQAAESTLRCLYGDEVADYARTKFLRAIETGDMRAFKIRLLVLKARDSLVGTSILTDFISGIEECISSAEETAGCTPDPSPRRLSLAEQERKRRLDALRMSKKERQPELNLVWTGKSANATESCQGGIRQPVQDIEHRDIDNNDRSVSSSDELSDRHAQTPKNSISCKPEVDGKNGSKIKSKRKSNRVNDSSQIAPVTVTGVKSVTVTPQASKHRPKFVRKTRAYETVEEILADVEAGVIAPYESAEEIGVDVQDGVLTEAEAFLFTLALDRYNPMSDAGFDSGSVLKVDRSRAEEDDEDHDEELLDEEGDDAGDGESVWNGSSISYNPRGFGGCGGSYSFGGMDWNPDDD